MPPNHLIGEYPVIRIICRCLNAESIGIIAILRAIQSFVAAMIPISCSHHIICALFSKNSVSIRSQTLLSDNVYVLSEIAGCRVETAHRREHSSIGPNNIAGEVALGHLSLPVIRLRHPCSIGIRPIQHRNILHLTLQRLPPIARPIHPHLFEQIARQIQIKPLIGYSLQDSCSNGIVIVHVFVECTGSMRWVEQTQIVVFARWSEQFREFGEWRASVCVVKERVVGVALLQGGLVGQEHLQGHWAVGEEGVDYGESDQIRY